MAHSGVDDGMREQQMGVLEMAVLINLHLACQKEKKNENKRDSRTNQCACLAPERGRWSTEKQR
jgi:hypothetical protein